MVKSHLRFLNRRAPADPARAGAERDDQFLRKVWHSTRERWQRLALLGILGWASYSLILGPDGGIQLWHLRGRAENLRGEISALAATRDSLDRILDDWIIYGDQYLERTAREDYKFARENERIYLLPYDEEDDRCVRDALIHGGDRFSDRAARRAQQAQPVTRRAGLR